MDNGEGLTKAVIKHNCGSSAEVHLFGACVTSWTQSSGDEVLYCRPDAVFDGSKPISGGIPHCFPQVCSCAANVQRGPLPTHVLPSGRIVPARWSDHLACTETQPPMTTPCTQQGSACPHGASLERAAAEPRAQAVRARAFARL